MKRTIIFLFLFSSFLVRSQSNEFAGSYAMGELPEQRGGLLYLFPNSDSTLLFYIELGRGAPSYGSGAMVGEINLTSSNSWKFNKPDTSLDLSCELSFIFYTDSLKVSTANGSDECGYGFGVYSDGMYARTSRDIPTYFIDRLGKKTDFKDLDIENWSE